MRIMTANIWGDYFGNAVSMRETEIEEIIRKYSPDVIGMQEITEGWYKSNLFENLSNDYILVEGVVGNYTPILLRKNKFEVIERGWEVFLETPDSSKSITWLVIKDKTNKKNIAVCNTHLWWMERGAEDEELRLKNAKQLFGRIEILKKKYEIPVFAFGDFNSKENGSAIKYLSKNKFVPAYKFADKYTDVSSYHGNPIRGKDDKYHGNKTKNKISESLDHILTFGGNVNVRDYIVVEEQKILDASDHSPVYIDAEIF